MKIKTLLTAALTLLLAGLLILPQPADAKRMGGGGSYGKQYSTPSQTATPGQAQSPAAMAGAGQRAPAPGGASRWLGPLAGLAAGGLLASLFFGGAFEGFQFMDFLLIAALVFGAFLLIRRFKRSQASPLPAGAYGRSAATGARLNAGPDATPAIQGSGAVGALPQTAIGNQAPTWFDAAGFVAGAKGHYMRLQASWDKADYADIRSYTTPELFAELQRDRESLGGPQYTEVVQLNAELMSVQRDGDQAVASILFTGLVREDRQAPAQPIRDIWHVQHAWASPAGDWFIVGIQSAE
jgi:predicted lipid-binding transport protein (Tim44 family)